MRKQAGTVNRLGPCVRPTHSWSDTHPQLTLQAQIALMNGALCCEPSMKRLPLMLQRSPHSAASATRRTRTINLPSRASRRARVPRRARGNTTSTARESVGLMTVLVDVVLCCLSRRYHRGPRTWASDRLECNNTHRHHEHCQSNSFACQPPPVLLGNRLVGGVHRCHGCSHDANECPSATENDLSQNGYGS